MGINLFGWYHSDLGFVSIFGILSIPIWFLARNSLIRTMETSAQPTSPSASATATGVQGSGRSTWGVIKFSLVGIILLASAGAYVWINAFSPLVLDNPTDKAISVKIDGNSYSVNARSKQEISVGFGSHSLQLDGSGAEKFDRAFFDGGSVMNPTHSQYIITDMIYSTSQVTKDPNGKTIVVNGKTYEDVGNPRMTTDSYIKHVWDFPLDEELPSSVTINASSGTERRTKIFRPGEFETEYHDYLKSEETNIEQP